MTPPARSGYFFAIGLAIYLIAFETLLPLKLCNLHALLFYYPAEGSSQESKNFVRLVLVVLPGLATIGMGAAAVALAAFERRRHHLLGILSAGALFLTCIVLLFGELNTGILGLVVGEYVVVFLLLRVVQRARDIVARLLKRFRGRD